MTEQRDAAVALSRLAAIVESSADAIIGKDLDGIVTSWNKGAETIFGYTADEMIGMPMMRLIPVDRHDEEDHILGKIRRGENVETFETLRLTRSGRMIEVSVTASPIKDAEGRIIGASKIARDITLLKEREREIARLSQLYAALSQINQSIVWTTNRDELFAHVCEILVEPGGFRMVWFGWHDPETNLLVPVASCGDELGELKHSRVSVEDTPEGRGPSGTAFREGRPQISNDMLNDPSTLPWRDVIARSALRASAVFPIRLNGVVRGTLGVYATQPLFFEHREIALLKEAASDVSFALDNIAREQARQQAEEALRESEERLRTVTENLAEGLLIFDLDNNLLEWNRAGYQMHGFHNIDEARKSLHELDAVFELSTLDGKLLPPEQRPLQRIMRGEELRNTELRIRRRGTDWERIFSYSGAVVREASGQSLAYVSIEDVTARKRSEAALQTSEARYRSLFDYAPDGIVIADPDSYYLDANASICRMLGYAREELVGLHAKDIVMPAETAYIGAALKTIKSRDDYHREWEFRRKDGSAFPAEVIATVMPDGNLMAMIRDITERRAAEVALRDVNEMLRQKMLQLEETNLAWQRDEADLRLRDRAIRAVTPGIVITDPSRPDNPIIYASPGFARMTGYAIDEILGRNCRFLQGDDTDPTAVALIREALHAGRSCTVELVNYRKDGTPFWNSLAISAVVDRDGKLTHFVGVQTDVTERRRLEEQFRQAQKMEAVGQLAGGIAHDFNNLLMVIISCTEVLLKSSSVDDRQRSLLEEIRKAVERSASLTRQLLAFSRKQVLTPRVLDLNDVVRDTERMLRRVIGEDIALTTTLHPRPDRIKADLGQLEQVLLNLAVNARDAMPQGGKLTIETSNVELDESYTRIHSGVRSGPYVMLAVSDTGPGMTDDVKQHLFEPFFTTKGSGKGTGLGLAVVHGVVKQSGGAIEVYSELGIGSSFKIYLPIVDDAPVAKPSNRLGPAPHGTETILLVEDEEIVRELTRTTLQDHGYTVLEAGHGEEGLSVAARHAGPIHLLVTDVVMPGMGGRILAERLTALHPETKVLYVSGYTDDAIVRHGILHEEVNFLQKPCSPTTLAHKVREVLMK